jgi:hypothetical protein
MNQILFATKNQETASIFNMHVIVKKHQKEFRCKAYLVDGKVFYIKNDTRELLHELEIIHSQDILSNTILIIDYDSLYEDFTSLKSADETRISPIAELFLSYPELKIWIYKEENKECRLFGCDEENSKRYAIIIKNSDDLKKMGDDIYSYQQLFDPSGIRAFLRDKLTRQLIKFKQDNYDKLHKSRKKNIAIVVDEEQYHTNLWGYALYDFGYSVIPVNYEKELIETKGILYPNQNEEAAIDGYKPLIIRDFDLQFPDLRSSNVDFCSLCKKEKKIAHKDCGDSNMYAFRGIYKPKLEDEKKSKSQGTQESLNHRSSLHDCRNAFWGTFHGATTYVITQNSPYEKTNPFINQRNGSVLTKPGKYLLWEKLYTKLRKVIAVAKRSLIIVNLRAITDEHSLIKSSGLIFDKSKSNDNHDGYYYLVGLSKEVEGMYDLLNMPAYGKYRNNIIKQTYQNSRDYREILKDRQNMDSHSIPPLNRTIVERLIKKAKFYYETKQYLLAAINASEALEVLNGLAKSLAYEALHLKVVSEVQMELRTKGVGNFKNVLNERINNVFRQKKRLAGDNKEAERNITMQIFNDLRVIYESHEQFGAADDAFAVAKKAEIGLSGKNDKNYEVARYKYQKSKKGKKMNSDKNSETSREESQNRNHEKENIKHPRLLRFLWIRRPPILRNWLFLWIFLPFLFLISVLYCYGSYNNIPASDWIYGAISVTLLLPFILNFNQAISFIVRTGTDIFRLAFTFLLVNIFLIFAYNPDIIFNYSNYNWNNFPDVFMTSFMNEPINNELVCYDNHDSWGYRMLATSHVLISVIYMGIFISSMYRKFVRR